MAGYLFKLPIFICDLDDIPGVLGKIFGSEAQHKLEKWTQTVLTGLKKRGSIALEIGKKESIGLNINTMRGQSDRAWLFEGFEDAEKGTQSD